VTAPFFIIYSILNQECSSRGPLSPALYNIIFYDKQFPTSASRRRQMHHLACASTVFFSFKRFNNNHITWWEHKAEGFLSLSLVSMLSGRLHFLIDPSHVNIMHRCIHYQETVQFRYKMLSAPTPRINYAEQIYHIKWIIASREISHTAAGLSAGCELSSLYYYITCWKTRGAYTLSTNGWSRAKLIVGISSLCDGCALLKILYRRRAPVVSHRY
jgi:hypothetical protein